MSIPDAANDFRGRLTGGDSLSGSQKLMILVLSMTLYGVGDLVCQIIPAIEAGPFDIGVSYFSFIAVVLAALLNPFWVAIGAPLGELVFSDMLLGDFGGFTELEGFLQTALAIFVAGTLIKDPRNLKQLAIAPVVMVLVDKLTGGVVDILKVVVGVDPDTLEEADGLISTLLFMEGADIVITVILSGIIFGSIPTMWLTPRLYGKIEPIMGLRPRDPQNPPKMRGPWGVSIWVVGALVFLVAGAITMFAAWEEFVGREGIGALGAFEPDFREQFGDFYLWIAILIAAAVGCAAFLALRAVQSKRRTPVESGSSTRRTPVESDSSDEARTG
ncbi:cell division protein FtsQ [Epidermidibacterium keratini]|uniref:Cell division protein FtsQ n=1 Tax=Epidermidibacterium keratini TaxID=1891644 RepID=A0A7L4YJU2_9ACTN|nr:cell division protein FtsQ [Epidermidibacterium keratini]QHB99534.1 cell division protein FtsQ [Epidermidibacterium keratini]